MSEKREFSEDEASSHIVKKEQTPLKTRFRGVCYFFDSMNSVFTFNDCLIIKVVLFTHKMKIAFTIWPMVYKCICKLRISGKDENDVSKDFKEGSEEK